MTDRNCFAMPYNLQGRSHRVSFAQIINSLFRHYHNAFAKIRMTRSSWPRYADVCSPSRFSVETSRGQPREATEIPSSRRSRAANITCVRLCAGERSTAIKQQQQQQQQQQRLIRFDPRAPSSIAPDSRQFNAISGRISRPLIIRFSFYPTSVVA
jgi:hypothetical protein